MFNVYLGHFHPDLEEALCRSISEIKSEDPLAPVAIIVPSDRIRSRIKIFLAKEKGLNLIGVHFLTFHGLAMQLCKEKYGILRRLAGDDFILSEFIRCILKSGFPGSDRFRHFTETRDGCEALRSSIQDLEDAHVDPGNMAEAIREGVFSAEDAERILPLMLLYKEFLRQKETLEIAGYSDLPVIAAGCVPSSKYLKKFKEIIYYGFYDLTQVQYDFFKAVIQNYRASLYFPLIKDIPAFAFAQKFFDGYIQGLIHDDRRLHKLSSADLIMKKEGTLFPIAHKARLISASGAEDEVLTAAKGILQHVEQRGYQFSDIGVVARNLDDYTHLIRMIFEKHKIPFISSSGEPLSRHLLCKAVHLLLSIPAKNYRRADIIDLLSSHYFRIQGFCPEGIDPRPDLWDLVTRSIGITKGMSEWGRLDHFIDSGFDLQGDDPDKDEDTSISGIQLAGIRNFIVSLDNDFSSLPKTSTWSDYSDRFGRMIQKYLNTEKYVEDILISMKDFDWISSEASSTDFIDAFMRKLERSSIPEAGGYIEGVHVLDAMTARCMPFKVLYILGMNEKVFPRNIREDPLLRDSARKVMENSLGYKISEKMAGYDEEKLLFHFLISSARDSVFIFYQRTDEAGQIRIPSWYLSEIRRDSSEAEEKIPRRISEKFRASDFYSYDLLTPKEACLRMAMEGKDIGDVMLKMNFKGDIYQQGIKALGRHNRMKNEIAEFDGSIGPMNKQWDILLQNGISPTALEQYARCPFSYYARNVLNLRSLKQPETVINIPPADIGSICHRILKKFYSRLIDSAITDSNRHLRYLAEDTAGVFQDYQEMRPAGYQLVWDVLQERVYSVLYQMIKNDLEKMKDSGFLPHSLEIEVTGHFPDEFPQDLKDVFVHGVLDRIDIRLERNQFRIVEYKFRSGKKISSEDNNLILSAIRGKRLQPPLYLLIATQYAERILGMKNPGAERISFYFIAPEWSSGENDESMSIFPGDCWNTSLSGIMTSTITLLLRGIRDGIYFILPGSYCDMCDYSTICRKNHLPTRWRAGHDPAARPYFELRKSSLKNDSE